MTRLGLGFGDLFRFRYWYKTDWTAFSKWVEEFMITWSCLALQGLQCISRWLTQLVSVQHWNEQLFVIFRTWQLIVVWTKDEVAFGFVFWETHDTQGQSCLGLKCLICAQVARLNRSWLTVVPNGKHFVKWYYCGRNPRAIRVNFSIKPDQAGGY